MIPARKPPMATSGIVPWLRDNMFSSIINSIISILALIFVVLSFFNLFQFIFFEGHWERVWANMKLFGVYTYPLDLLWRPLTAAAITMGLVGLSAGLATHGEDGGEIMVGVFWWFFALVALLAVLGLIFWESIRFAWLIVALANIAMFYLGKAVPQLSKRLMWLWVVGILLSFVLIAGILPADSNPDSAFRFVKTKKWGGFMLTLIISAFGIIASFPLGIALALGRKSKLPVLKYFSIGFIEIVRGAPLIAWLFIASVFVPLLLDQSPDKIPGLYRVLAAVTFFSAAYMAENVRGGLAAVPKGQTEAAQALGLSAWQNTRMIVLPQALRAVIPAIVGQAIGLFKDTSLVFVVGLADIFMVHKIVSTQPESLLITGGIRLELSLFLVIVYWYFSFRMSIASRQLEKQLGVGER
ncbi:MAG TPA: amino acid ABC transporter permease [Trueperaceae bacterium]|nr:amino acid ABC transporter permease [Trueperaceae bacterium]